MNTRHNPLISNYHRLTWLVHAFKSKMLDRLETLVFLVLMLFIILLMTSCASPCGPSITLAKPPTGNGLGTMVESVGIRCEWRYQ